MLCCRQKLNLPFVNPAPQGEPMPVAKRSGDSVSAGTVNCDGTLTVSVERAGEATAVADIVRAVESAQARAAPVQRLADTISGHFCYGVMAASAATFGFWAVVAPKALPAVIAAATAGAASSPQSATLSLACKLAASVLVVACPCALGLATPTAVLVGTSLGARNGLFIRGGDVLERAQEVDTVVFDKTGTLTRGKPRVLRVTPSAATRLSEAEILCLAAAVERNARHPIAAAIVAATASASSSAGAASAASTAAAGAPAHLHVQDGSFRQEPGAGASAVVGGRRVVVGNEAFVRASLAASGSAAASGDSASLRAAADGPESVGSSMVYVSVDGVAVGAVELADTVRTWI